MKHWYSFKYTDVMTKCIGEIMRGIEHWEDLFLFYDEKSQLQAQFCQECGNYCRTQSKLSMRALCLCEVDRRFHEMIITHKY